MFLCLFSLERLLASIKNIVVPINILLMFYMKTTLFFFYSYCNQRWFFILANIGTKYPFVKLHGLQSMHGSFITNYIDDSLNKICIMCSKLYRYIQLILLNWTTMLQQIQIHSNFSFSIHRLFLYLSSPFPSISFAGMTVYLFLTSMRWVYANSSTIDCAVLYYTLNRKDLYCSHTLHMWTRYLFIFKNRFQPY